MNNKLENKVVVVTGASKGIGAGIAKQMGASGAKVVVNYASSKESADAGTFDLNVLGVLLPSQEASMKLFIFQTMKKRPFRQLFRIFKKK